jgi:hypothetical protein
MNEQHLVLFKNLERDLKMIVKWLKDSGLKVNEGKTEIFCSIIVTTIKLQGLDIKTKKEVTVL